MSFFCDIVFDYVLPSPESFTSLQERVNHCYSTGNFKEAPEPFRLRQEPSHAYTIQLVVVPLLSDPSKSVILKMVMVFF